MKTALLLFLAYIVAANAFRWQDLGERPLTRDDCPLQSLECDYGPLWCIWDDDCVCGGICDKKTGQCVGAKAELPNRSANMRCDICARSCSGKSDGNRRMCQYVNPADEESVAEFIQWCDEADRTFCVEQESERDAMERLQRETDEFFIEKMKERRLGGWRIFFSNLFPPIAAIIILTYILGCVFRLFTEVVGGVRWMLYGKEEPQCSTCGRALTDVCPECKQETLSAKKQK